MFGVECKGNLLKYERIIEEMKEAVRQKKFLLGDVVPSITAVANELGCSRETVVKAYAVLKKEGVLDSKPGKGFYVATETIINCPKIFLLLNNLTPYMEVLYNSFVEALDGRATVDVFFHHNRIDMFEQLIKNNCRKYYSYIVKPFAHERVSSILEAIDSEELLILDRREGINEHRSYISQDFSDDFYCSLYKGSAQIKKYNKLVLTFSPRWIHPAVCVEAFKRYVAENAINAEVVEHIGKVELGSAYIVLTDDDLVEVLRQCRDNGWEVGHDVGVISYNDTPLKEFVAGGVTVISADFAGMGRAAAMYALSRNRVTHSEQARLILRDSL